jgi:uncharacterized protein (DUF4415 family)
MTAREYDIVELARLRPTRETHPELVEEMTQRRKTRGRPKTASPKVRTSIYLSQAVLDKFKATGDGWQTRINEVLEKARIQHVRGEARTKE